jgi:hypothetical protein
MSENIQEQAFDTTGGQPTNMKVFPWGSPTIGQIAGALAKAQGAMHNPAKTRKVAQTRWSKKEGKEIDASYWYATLNDIQNTARAALAENGISVFQPVSGDIARIEITTVLLHSSGEWMATDPLFTTPVGYGSNGPNIQDMGSVITYLRRYSLCSVLNLSAAEDDTDGKTEEPDEPQGQGKPPARQAPAQQPAQQQPAGRTAPAPAPAANNPKPSTAAPAANTAKPAASTQAPKPQPAAQPAKQEKPAQAGNPELEQAQQDFAADFEAWVKDDRADEMKGLLKLLTASCAICSDDTDQWKVDDFRTFTCRMDFEAAKKEWAAKGVTAAGVEEVAAGLHAAGELKKAVIDQLDEADYLHLMDVLDKDNGTGKYAG